MRWPCSKDVTAFPPETAVGTLVNCFVIKQMRRVPIVEDEKVIGLVSRRDILREIQNHYSPSKYSLPHNLAAAATQFDNAGIG
ncbi:MAG: CBS domain-containing protein [Candidatus Latescibacteria bacterium]|nr:CBS domain-containing protein [Candidatus Latescibacterota bacterium]